MNHLGNTKHGDRYTRLYGIWKAMRERCNTKGSSNYKNYGARGITICKEWDDYLAFKDWAIKNGYKDDLTIDRIDVNDGYNPNNCRWTTYKTQANNRTNNHRITVDNVTLTISEWSDILGISSSTIFARLKRGYSPEEAIAPVKNYNTSPLKGRKRIIYKEIDGEEWMVFCEEPDIKVSNYGRVRVGDFLIKPTKKSDGHYEIFYKRKSYMLNRMVATCFVNNPKNYKYVHHIDGNKENNNANNLFWSNHKKVMR